MSDTMKDLWVILGVLVAGGCVLVSCETKMTKESEGESMFEHTDLSVEERIGDCQSFDCILKEGEKFPSLCHMKAHGRFTRAIVDCDATCKVLRAADPKAFDCWRIEACDQDAECARIFGIEPL